jgi:hypothetical protein
MVVVEAERSEDEPVEILASFVQVTEDDEMHTVGARVSGDFATGKDDHAMPSASLLHGVNPLAGVVVSKGDDVDAGRTRSRHVVVQETFALLRLGQPIARPFWEAKVPCGSGDLQIALPPSCPAHKCLSLARRSTRPRAVRLQQVFQRVQCLLRRCNHRGVQISTVRYLEFVNLRMASAA